MAKDSLAQELVALVRKEFGKESALLATGEKQGVRSEVTDVLPLGVSPVDHHVLGIGGLPGGRIVELYSEEGGGKTSLLLAWLGSAQREGGLAVLQETEESFNLDRVKLFGVDTDDLLVLQPVNMEQAIDQQECVLDLLANKLKPKGPSLLGWDSIAATPTEAELEAGLDSTRDKEVQDTRAKLLSQACRQLPKLAVKARCVLLYINQIREKRGVMFGDKYTTPGGRAVKFAASIRLQLLGGKAIKVKGQHIGKDVTLIAAKNKLSSPWRKCRLRLIYEKGYDERWSTLDHAKSADAAPAGAKGAAAYTEALAKLGWKPPANDTSFDLEIPPDAVENADGDDQDD